MTVFLVKVYEVVNDYKNFSEDKGLVIEIGGEFLVLCRVVIKKYTLDSERAFKFYLV